MTALRRAALLLTLAGACGDGSEDGVEIPCDIADESCRRAVFVLTSKMREQPGARMPPSRIITRQQYEAESRAELRQPTLQDQQFTAALRVLHFLPEGSSSEEETVESNVGGVAAYYASDTKAITIIADQTEEPLTGSLTLSHEYVHALQDAREGLERISANAFSTDEVMSGNALIEGEATMLADAALRDAMGLPYDLNAVLAYVGRMLEGLLEDIERSDAPLNEGVLVLPYPVGTGPLAQAYSREGVAGVQRFYSKLPTTLAGWVDTSRVGLPLRLTCEAPEPPAGYQRITPDRLGVTGLIAFEAVLGAPGAQAYANARAWTNDSFAMFVPTQAMPLAAVAWRIGLTDATAASALETRVRAANLGLSVERQGNEVVITGATQAALLDGWTVRNACSAQKSLERPTSQLREQRRWFARMLERLSKGAEGGTRTRMP